MRQQKPGRGRPKPGAPTVIFIDEIDSLVPVRGGLGEPAVTERVVNTIMSETDGSRSRRASS